MADHAMESVESFTARARTWLAGNMPRIQDGGGRSRPAGHSDEEELARISRDRDLQRRLFDGGFAGICVPADYGGQGLTTPTKKHSTGRSGVTTTRPLRRSLPSLHACPSFWNSGPTSRSNVTSPRSSRERRSGCSSCRSPAEARTWPVRSRQPCVTERSGSSTGPKSGPPEPGGRTGVCAWSGPTGMFPSTGDSPCSCWRSTNPA